MNEQTVSFFKNYAGTYTGELICHYRDLPPIIIGTSFEDVKRKATEIWGSFTHAKDCECPDCN